MSLRMNEEKNKWLQEEIYQFVCHYGHISEILYFALSQSYTMEESIRS